MVENKLNIALIGYGKMGKIIEKVAISRGHTIGLTISKDNIADFNSHNLKDIDVAIEFTVPHIAANNLIKLSNNGIPAVSGTTGWLDDYDKVTSSFISNKTGFLYASNFSLGVNIFFAINKQLAKAMNALSSYDISMTEAHHITKVDAPSGTAVTIANQIIEEVDRKKEWSLEGDDHKNIKIDVIREEDIKGDHEVKYTSSIDEITIKHEAFSREGFALGAVLAAEYIANKQSIHTMQDVLNLPAL